MTDRELLELAAKAAGFTNLVHWVDENNDYDSHLYGLPCLCPEKYGRPFEVAAWNPLIDDGDALRLSASLRMGIEHNLPCDDDLWVVVNSDTGKDLAWEEFETETDRISATRRAIVRAAAEIGKNMEGEE